MAGFVLQAKDKAGQLAYYTGRAGAGWVSQDRAAAWVDSEANQSRKAGRFNRMTAVHGLSFACTPDVL